MGIVDTISLYGTVVLAIPIAFLGVEFLVTGERPVLGAVFVGLAVALFLGRQYLPDVKGELLGGASDVVLGDAADPGDGAGTGGETGAGADGESTVGTDGESTAGTDDDTVRIPDAEAGE
jgi:hypothetical protein